MQRRTWMVCLLTAALVLSSCSLVPPPPPGSYPDDILFIGTSDTFFNEGLEKHVQGMAAASVPPLYIETDAATIGGAPLANLWRSPMVQKAVQEGGWDVVVVEGEVAMGDTEDEASYIEYVGKFDELIRSVGARPVLFLDWQIEPGSHHAKYYPTAGMEDIGRIVSAAGAMIDAEVAPVGLAWQRSLAERPELEIYDPDGIHPNAAGTYLTTAVFYATLFGRSPEGIAYDLGDIFPEHEAYDKYRQRYAIPDEDKAFLQRIAWETVQEYQAQQQ